MSGLFKEYYKDEKSTDFSTRRITICKMKSVGSGKNKVQRPVADVRANIDALQKEHKENNDMLRLFAKNIKESGLTQKQYQDMGFVFNGVLKDEFRKSSRYSSTRELVKPMLVKEIKDKDRTYKVHVPLNDDSYVLPNTIEMLEERIRDAIFETGVLVGRYKMKKQKESEFAKFIIENGGDELRSFVSAHSKQRRMK